MKIGGMIHMNVAETVNNFMSNSGKEEGLNSKFHVLLP